MTSIEEMDCQDLVELVTEYFEGTLSAEMVERIEFHLTECDGCTEYLAQMRRTSELCGRVAPEELSPSARAALLAAFRAA